MNFQEIYNKLSIINESILSENIAKPIDLAKCRVISSDVQDIRGEYETSSCLEYAGELTRIQVRTVIIRETENGREFLAKKFRYRTSLPGGGYDQEKDHGDIIASAKREALEEFNFILTNVKDTGIRTWRHREDPWVEQHINNPEDRWTGYYSYFVVGKVSGNGNNENPEELNKWKWYPIKDLEKVNKDVYEYVSRLEEAWGDGLNTLGEQELTYPDIISYCCENPESLNKILKSGLIRAAQQAETHETDKEARSSNSRGKLKLAKYKYVSLSKQLYSHAYRRPLKWGFGIALSQKALEQKGYELVDRDHAYNTLQFVALFVSRDRQHYLAQTTLYGFVEINEKIFNIIAHAMQDKSNRRLTTLKTDLSNAFVKNSMSVKDSWLLVTAIPKETLFKTANNNIQNIDYSEKISLAGSKYYQNQYSVGKGDFSEIGWKMILDFLLGNTYYNEGELRFWCKNGEDGIHFNANDLYGIILPKVVLDNINTEVSQESPTDDDSDNLDDDIELQEDISSVQQEALYDILEFAEDNNLQIYAHSALNSGHLKYIDRNRGISNKGTTH